MSGSKKRARSRKNGNGGKSNDTAAPFPLPQPQSSTSSEKLSPPLVPQHHHFAPTPSMAPPSSSLVPPTGLGNTTYVSHSMLGHRLGLLGPPSSASSKDNHKASGGAGGLKRIRAPHPHDVLCGRGGGINSHPGNRTFRDWVRERKESYNLAPSKAEKARIAREIVNKVRDLVPSGRFLAREGGASNAGMPVVTHGAAGASGLAGFWVEIDDVKAMAKTSQALREGAPSIRAQHKAAVAGVALPATGKVTKGGSSVAAPAKGKSGAKAANAVKVLKSDELNKLKDQAGAVSDPRRHQRATKKSTAIRPRGAVVPPPPIFPSSGRKPTALPQQPVKLSPTSAAQALDTASKAAKESAGSTAATTKKEETTGTTKEEKEAPTGKRLLPTSTHNPPDPPPPPPPLLKGPALSSVFDSPHLLKRQKWSLDNLKPGEESDSRDDFDSEAKMKQLLSLERSIAPTPPMTPPQPGAGAFSLQGKTPKLMPMSPPLGSMHGHFYGLPSPSLSDPALSMMFANNYNHMPLSPLPTPTMGAGGAASGGVEFNVNGRKSRSRSGGGNMNRAHSLELEASLPGDKAADDSESEFTDPFENDTELLREAGLGHDTANPHNGSLFYGKNGSGSKSGGEKNSNKGKSIVKSNKENSNEKNCNENQGEKKNPGDDKASGPKGTFRRRTTSSSAGSHGDMGGLKALTRQASNKSSRSLTSDLSDLPDPNAHLHDDVDFNEGMKAVYDAAHPGLTSPRDGDSIPTYLYPLRGGSKGNSKCVSPLSGNLRHHKISMIDVPKPAPTHRSISPSPGSSPIQARAMHGRFNDNWWTSFPHQ